MILLKLASNIGGDWLVCCEEIPHIHNWQEDIKKWSEVLDLSNTSFHFICYASAKKYAGQVFQGMIFDECHHATSPKRKEHLQAIKAGNCIALSATIKSDLKKTIKSLMRGKLHWSKVPLIKAISVGLLPKPEIKVHIIELDDTEQTETYIVKKGSQKNAVPKHMTYLEYDEFLLKTKEKSYCLHISCTQQEKYAMMTIAMLDYERLQYKNQFFKNRFLGAASARKRFIASLKKDYLCELLKRNFEKRTLVFTGSIAQADEIAEMFDINAMHSKKNRKEILKTIQDFNDKKLKTIASVKMGRESMNFTDIECVIIGQLDSTELTFIQMLGRSLRYVKPECHIVICKGTQDFKYGMTALRQLNYDWYEIIRDVRSVAGND